MRKSFSETSFWYRNISNVLRVTLTLQSFFLQRHKNRHNLHHYHVHHAARQELVSTVRTGLKLAEEKRRRAENARKAKSMAEVLKENEDLKKRQPTNTMMN